MALAHKGLAFDARPVRFTEIPTIGNGRHKTLPVIDDGGHIVGDSPEIADYLETMYPERPSLFGGPGGAGLCRFVQNWCVSVLHPGIARLIIRDIHDRLLPQDQPYFRETRERRFGRTLEEVQAGREQWVEEFRRSLQPLRLTLQAARFLGGEGPLYADYVIFGAFQWARLTSPFRLLAEGDPIGVWFARCLDLYDGLGRRAPGYD